MAKPAVNKTHHSFQSIVLNQTTAKEFDTRVSKAQTGAAGTQRLPSSQLRELGREAAKAAGQPTHSHAAGEGQQEKQDGKKEAKPSALSQKASVFTRLGPLPPVGPR
ncbi:hypothetical protein WJX72_002107 [[Myrmecia] bisecta]|uniref:Uncharacterized protein n=1 Tax=[Myrmecia] bisecta TaxID=41462 RepID=A0AAW1PFF7_9CHLO